uniref:Phlebovirus glycoprotein G2 fusion domain-containing protein n=1 Tax=Wuchereria bancrofti TaxID=6293 RepID=A0A1I8EEW3_WUCBA
MANYSLVVIAFLIMYTQNEEQWKETDDLGSCEYRRRITHEDICNCYSSLRSSSQDWRKSTDHCAGYNDYATLYPSNLWFQNDLRGRSRQRCCHSSNNYCKFCNCYCRNQQRYRKSRSEAIHNRRKRWNAFDSMHHSGQFVKSSENLRTIPMTYAPTLPNFQANNTINSRNTTMITNDNSVPITTTTTTTTAATTTTTTATTTTTTATPYYGPFLARKIRITPALIEKSRSFHEYYSSERKYFNEIQNDQCDIVKNLSNVTTTTNNKPMISDNIITKHVCNEFDEIPLYVSKNSNIDNEMKSTNLSPLISIDKFEQISGRNTIMEKNYNENGRATLMEGLALLKHRMKEHEKRLILSHQNNEMKLYSKKNSEIRDYLHEKMQQFAIKKIANYSYKKTFKKYEQMENFSQKLVSTDKYKKHTDMMKSISKNVENTSSNAIIDNSANNNDNNDSNQSKFITEIRQVREKLRKISDNFPPIIDNRNGTKNTTSTNAESKIGAKELSSNSHEIFSTYSTQQSIAEKHNGIVENFKPSKLAPTFHITGKTESKPQNTMIPAKPTATAIITSTFDDSSKCKSSPIYNGGKYETITAEVYIRNPMNLKPTIINISTIDEKMKKPYWMVLNTYESPPGTIDRNNILRKKFDKTTVQVGSDPLLLSDEKVEEMDCKLKTTNSSEIGCNIISNITNPEMKQELSERNNAKTLISFDSKLQPENNHIVKTETDTTIKSRIITKCKCFGFTI